MRETLKQNFMPTDPQIKHLSSSPMAAFTATAKSNGDIVDNESGATKKQNRQVERTDLGHDSVREKSRQTPRAGAFSCDTGSADKYGKTEHHRPKLVSARLSRPSETVRHPGKSSNLAGATAPGSNGSDGDAISGVDPSFGGDSSDEGSDPSCNGANDLRKAQGGVVFRSKVSSPRPSDDVQLYGL